MLLTPHGHKFDNPLGVLYIERSELQIVKRTTFWDDGNGIDSLYDTTIKSTTRARLKEHFELLRAIKYYYFIHDVCDLPQP